MQVCCLSSRTALISAACIWALVFMWIQRKILTQHEHVDAQIASRSLQASSRKDVIITCGSKQLKLVGDKRCLRRHNWVKQNWWNHSCFHVHRFSSSEQDMDCYIYRYLVFVERVCSVPERAADFFAEILLPRDVAKEQVKNAYVDVTLRPLLKRFDQCGNVCLWMQNRIENMQANWLKNAQNVAGEKEMKTMDSVARAHAPNTFNPGRRGRNTNAQNTTCNTRARPQKPRCSGVVSYGERIRLKVLLHMGLLTKQHGLNFGEAALNGGPLGELVQWSDLAAGLHVLGHDVHLSWSPSRLESLLVPSETNVCKLVRKYDLIFTDIVGLEQLRHMLGSIYHYRGLLRILDVYGTEPQFNHPVYNPQRGDRTWGGKGLNPAQFFTHFPHSPDNSFLGFVVEKRQGRQRKVENKKVALLYGKRSILLEGRNEQKLLHLLNHNFDEVHATMSSRFNSEDDKNVPDFVINHKNLEQADFFKLLESASVYVGLGLPVEGPAALESAASGVIFLNPLFRPPRPVAKNKPTTRKLTSQNPYAENVLGEPHVFTYDVKNFTELGRILSKIKQLPSPSPHVPFEFTYFGFLERLNAYIENQDFEEGEIRTSMNSLGIFWRKNESWPPKTELKAKWSTNGESCTETCSRNGMVCERSFFPEINSKQALARRCTLARGGLAKNEKGSNGSASDHRITCHAPSYDERTEECIFQADQLMFSCACSPPGGVLRLCPCRGYQHEQRALCTKCS